MKTKYAKLIEQLERVTEAYERALAEVKTLESTIGEQTDVLGVYGKVDYVSDKFEQRRAIHLSDKTFTDAALECGTGFTHECWERYTRFECTMFGCRVFALVDKNSAEEAYLLMREAAEAKENE